MLSPTEFFTTDAGFAQLTAAALDRGLDLTAEVDGTALEVHTFIAAYAEVTHPDPGALEEAIDAIDGGSESPMLRMLAMSFAHASVAPFASESAFDALKSGDLKALRVLFGMAREARDVAEASNPRLVRAADTVAAYLGHPDYGTFRRLDYHAWSCALAQHVAERDLPVLAEAIRSQSEAVCMSATLASIARTGTVREGVPA